MNFIYEIMYYILNICYYKVMIVNGKEKIKYIIQKQPTGEIGTNDFIIDKSLKMAWFKLKDCCFTDGKKFLMTVDIKNALPLVCENSEYVEAEKIIIKNSKTLKIKMDEKGILNLDKESGLPIKLIELTYPPTMLYQAIDSHFVTKVMARPPNKWEWLSIPLIILFVVGGIIFYMFIINNGVHLT